MMTLADARQKLDVALDEKGKHIDGGLIVLDEHTIAKSYGWIFFYTGRRYHETRDILHAIGGNGPVVILADSGEVIYLGTAQRSEDEIARFERARGLAG